MKLMSKLFKKNNKGLSLVELICAIAILGLSTTAIGGAMVMSARHYQKDSAEFTIQQEAQLVTNQVGNLVVDAAEADWNPTSKKLTVQSDNKKHVIYQSGDKLLYEQYDNSNVKISDGVLAEGVAANGFTVDDSAFDSNKNVNISLTLDKDGRNIKADYNATSRNGKLADYEEAQQVAVISMEDVIIVEPQMTEANSKPYKALIKVNGMTWEEVGGVVIDTTTTDVPNGFNVQIKAEGGEHYLYVEAEQNAGNPSDPNTASSFPVYLKTVNPVGGPPLAEKQITVKVRRINDLIINNPSGTNITLGNANTEFVLYATAMGDNITEGFGFKYDDAPYDYVNPRYVEFNVESPVICEVIKTEDSDNPNVKIKLKENMADGQQIKVTAYSKHAYKGINKSGKVYDTSDNVVEQYIIECDRPAPPPIDPFYPVPAGDLSGMLRGEDYTWQTTVENNNADLLKSNLKTKYETELPGINMNYEWYVSFKEKGAPDTTWTPWHMTCQNGSNRKIDGTYETTIMLPDKAYDIRFFILYYDATSKKVLYPHDESLLEAGRGLAEAGFTKGWADEDAAATTFMQYGKTTELPETSLYYYDSDPNVQLDSVGSVDSPITYKYGDSTTPKVYFNMRHLSTARTMYTYTPVVWKLQSDNSWKKLTDAELSKVFECGMNDGSPRYIEFKEMQNYANTDDLKDAACGTYRIGLELGGTAKKYNSVAANSTKEKVGDVYTGFDDVTLTPMELYDETGTKGFIYFKIEK